MGPWWPRIVIRVGSFSACAKNTSRWRGCSGSRTWERLSKERTASHRPRGTRGDIVERRGIHVGSGGRRVLDLDRQPLQLGGLVELGDSAPHAPRIRRVGAQAKAG